MEVPRKAIEEAVNLMKQGRGNAALNRVRDYDITSFAQLERWANDLGIETWREASSATHDGAKWLEEEF